METKGSENCEQQIHDAVQREELEIFVQSLREFQLNEIASRKWFDLHEMIIKLSQQAILEVNSYREEITKEFLILHQKLKILVHEAFCILIWKTKILPNLLEIDPNPSASFLIYTVLFHEATAITLLEVVLFHENGCESLDEAALDLVDYCAQAIIQLIGLINMGHHENLTNIDVDESIISELERQKRDLLYKIGMRCISILHYLADKLDVLPLSVGRRMVTVHDIPCLLSELLHFRPWLRKTKKGFEKFNDGNWSLIPKGEGVLKVTKYEAQAWFCFRALLFNQNLMEIYEINEFRQRELGKCQGILNDVILDQLPPFGELKYFLCSLTVTSAVSNTNSKSRQNFLLEEVPQIQENILKNAEDYGGFFKIAEEQSEIFLSSERDDILSMAKRLNSAYNTDLWVEMEEKVSEKADIKPTNNENCDNCKKKADKKCSNCLNAYYCSRECQIENWPIHKDVCLTSTGIK